MTTLGPERFYDGSRALHDIEAGALSPEVREHLPCSVERSERELRELAFELATTLALPTRVTFVGARDGSMLEQQVRLRLWAGGGDRFREAAHAYAMRVYAKTDELDAWPKVSAAWRASQAVVCGPAWRSQWYATAASMDPSGREFLRLFFRAAQQTWTRAARTQAVIASRDTPNGWLLELKRAGAWPIGWVDDTLVVVRVRTDDVAPRSAIAVPTLAAPPSRPTPADDRLFLAASFQTKDLPQAWSDALHDLGFTVDWGPVAERSEMIEPQLGRSILAARAVICIAPSVDPDFGFPLWLRHELEYAAWAQQPIIVVRKRHDNAEPFEMPHLPCIVGLEPPESGTRHHPLVAWLDGLRSRS